MRRAVAISLLFCAAAAGQDREILSIDPRGPSHPFPHFWEQMFGSGRAILSLRDDYRRDIPDDSYCARVDIRCTLSHAKNCTVSRTSFGKPSCTGQT